MPPTVSSSSSASPAATRARSLPIFPEPRYQQGRYQGVILVLVLLFVWRDWADFFYLVWDSGYVFTHWLIDYQTFGWVKRGLLPSLLRLLGITHDSYFLLSAIRVILLLCLAGLCLCWMRQRWNFLLCALFCSGTVAGLAIDFVRFDAVLIGIALLQIALVIHRPSRWNLLWLPVLGVVAMLIHEAYLVLQLPLVWGIWVYVDCCPVREAAEEARSEAAPLFTRRRDAVRAMRHRLPYEDRACLRGAFDRALLLFGSAGAVWCLLAMHPPDPDLPFRQMVGNDPRIDPHMFYWFYLPIIEHAQISWESHLFTQKSWLQHLLLALYLLLTWRIIGQPIGRVLSAQWRNGRYGWMLLLLPTLTPLLLYSFTYDYYRWWRMVQINLFLALALLPHDWSAIIGPRRTAVFLAFCWLAGPMHTNEAFLGIFYQHFMGLWDAR